MTPRRVPPETGGAEPHAAELLGLDTRPHWRRPAGQALIGLVLVTLAGLLSRLWGDAAPTSAGADTFSRSAVGHAALLALLERAEKAPVVARRTPERLTGPTVPLLVLDPPLGAFEPSSASLEGRPRGVIDVVEAALEQGPVVIALPKWVATPGPRGLVREVTPLTNDDLDAATRWLGVELHSTACTAASGTGLGNRARFSVDLPHPRAMAQHSADGALGPLAPLVVCEGGEMLVASLDVGAPFPLIVISDPDLLNNHGLRRADHAALVLAVLDHLNADAIVIDETLHGYARPSGFWQRVQELPLALVPLHLAAVAAVLVWAGARRFGPVRPLPPRTARGSVALIERTAALLAATHRGPGLLAAYLRLATERAAAAWSTRAPALGTGAADAEERAAFDQLTERRAQGRLEALHESVKNGVPEQDVLRVAQNIHAWKESLTHDR